MNRARQNKNFWNTRKTLTQDSISSDELYDVVIIGAGITGITLGNELQKRNKKCLILEKEYPGSGTTGKSTAFINNFLETPYDELIQCFGESKAKVIADQAQETIQYIYQNIKNYQIRCEHKKCNFYLFSTEKEQNEKLTQILKAHTSLGIPTKRIYELPFDIPYKKALEIEGQLQFHPLKYLKRLLQEFEKNGGQLLSHCAVLSCNSQDDMVVIKTEDKKNILSKKVVWATHNPPADTRLNLLVTPYISYALCGNLKNTPPKIAQGGDLEKPYHYFRYHKSGKDYKIIAGGFDHKAGQENSTKNPFEDLEEYVKERFTLEVKNKWFAPYYTSADGLPYIGLMPGEQNIYVATGFGGDGMLYGSMAARIIPELMDGKESEISQLLSPCRSHHICSAQSIIHENVNSFFKHIHQKQNAELNFDLENIEKGAGKLTQCQGKTFAVYRDTGDSLHYLSPLCTHMGCTVQWNTTEKTWDCPCHGSQFEPNGRVIHGPALKNLEVVKIEHPEKEEATPKKMTENKFINP